MNTEVIERFIYANKKYFSENDLTALRHRLRDSTLKNVDRVWAATKNDGLKDPTVGLVLSLIFVPFDRFYVGDYGLMIAKLLTLAGFGFWGIADWFLIPKRCREVNMANFLTNLKEIEYKERQEEEEAYITGLKIREAELKIELALRREEHMKNHGYDSYVAEIDNALAMADMADEELENRRIANDRYNETMAALQKQNELIEESNKIAKRRAEDEEFWNIMRYYK